MGSPNFLTSEQEQQVIEAIRDAENQTSGEIRVHIEHKASGDPLDRAAYIFHELGMDETEQQNGVLIYIASDDHKAAIFAGKGIHKKAANEFWGNILDELLNHFKRKEFVKGLEKAVERVSGQLAELYPPDPGDVNELPDEISYKENRQK